MAPITDISQALLGSLAVLLAAIPAILGAIVLIIVGWIVAGVLAAVVVRVLRAIRIDQLADKAGVTTFLRRANVRARPRNRASASRRCLAARASFDSTSGLVM